MFKTAPTLKGLWRFTIFPTIFTTSVNPMYFVTGTCIHHVNGCRQQLLLQTAVTFKVLTEKLTAKALESLGESSRHWECCLAILICSGWKMKSPFGAKGLFFMGKLAVSFRECIWLDSKEPFWEACFLKKPPKQKKHRNWCFHPTKNW